MGKFPLNFFSSFWQLLPAQLSNRLTTHFLFLALCMTQEKARTTNYSKSHVVRNCFVPLRGKLWRLFLKGINFRGNFRTSELSVFTTQSFAKANLESPLTKAKRDGVCIVFRFFRLVHTYDACAALVSPQLDSDTFVVCPLTKDFSFFLVMQAQARAKEERKQFLFLMLVLASPRFTRTFSCA